jgi:hypothetical protein
MPEGASAAKGAGKVSAQLDLLIREAKKVL